MVKWAGLIEKQVRSSQLRKKLAKVKSAYSLNPCITVSREPCSRGRLITRKVSKFLKIEFYDKKLVDMIAKESKKKRELIDALDEKTQNTIGNIINSFLGLESLPEYSYIKSLSRVVCGISASHPAVIVGRGANFILPEKTALRVRVMAPFETRVKYAIKDKKTNEKEVKKKLIKIHRQRKEFISKYFNKNISNANYYDLVLNTKHLTVNQAVEIIIIAFKERFLS